MTILFQAVEEATQEAIYNSILAATTVKGFKGRTVEASSKEKVKELLKQHNIN